MARKAKQTTSRRQTRSKATTKKPTSTRKKELNAIYTTKSLENDFKDIIKKAKAMKKLTYGIVKETANKIEAAGSTPNVNLIQRALDMDGHKREIAKFLSKWQEDKYVKSVEEGKMTFREAFKKRTADLEYALSLVRSTLESTADGIIVVSNEGKIIDYNERLLNMFGVKREIMESRDDNVAMHYAMRQVKNPEAFFEDNLKIYENISDAGRCSDVYMKDGRVFERYSQPYKVGNKIIGRVWSNLDVTARRKAEESLRLRQRAIEASSYGVIITDAKAFKISYVNPAFEVITGYNASEVIGKNCNFLQGKDRDQVGINKLKRALKERREETVELRNYRKDGNLFWNELRIAPVPDVDGKITHYVGIITDITQRKAMEEQLRHQATHDKLTNLPNRTLLTDRIQQSIIQARSDHSNMALLFLDLDRFKVINDSLGHNTGDDLLSDIATRLNTCVKPGDTVARMGGDEFIVVINSLAKPEDAIPIAKKLLKEVTKPLHIQDRILNVTTSVGISCYPKDGKDMSTLLKNADIAMYKAKDNGGNAVQFYTTEMNARIMKLLTLENALRTAIKNKELELFYQPLFDLKTHKIIGAEALLRWQHPELGSISPADFIPLAEETGLIIPLGEWVLKTACKQNKIWHDMGFKGLYVAVNLSARQLQHTKISNSVKKILKETQLKPDQLELELTESIFLDNTDEKIKIMQQLKDSGVALAIDDFGTGYSSLSYLKKFPVNKLKIDQSFVRDIQENTDDRAIILAIIAMAKTLGLKVLAEGIETKVQDEFLTFNDCDQGQGFYFNKPMPVNKFTQLLKSKIKKQNHKTVNNQS